MKKTIPEEFFSGANLEYLMNSTNDLLSARLYSNSHSYSKRASISIAIEDKLTALEEDKILDSYPQLVDKDYRGWVVKRLRALGRRQFIEYAERSIKYGKNPQKLFISLIR